MSEPMRPMGLGEVLDRTFQIYRSRFLVFAGLAALPTLAMAVLVVANVLWWKALPDLSGPRDLLWFSTGSLFYLIVLGNLSTLLHLAIWPAVANVTAKTTADKQCGIASELKICSAQWKRWIGLTFANWLGGLILPELLVSGVSIGTMYLMFEVFKMDPSDPLDLGPKMFGASVVIGWVVFQWASACVTLSLPVWTLEDGKVLSSLRRGWKLSRGARWRIGFTRVAAACLEEILYVALMLSLFLALRLILGGSPFWWKVHLTANQFLQLAKAGMETVAGTLVGPVFPIALTLFYYDQRMRREGFDIEKLMDAAGWSAVEAAVREDVATVPVQPEGVQG